MYNAPAQLAVWPGMRSYTYTPAALLDTAMYKDEAGNNRTLVNTWDADSNRVRWLLYGTVYQTLVYDSTAGIPAVLQESFEGYDIYYIREPGGALVARFEGTAGLRYYHFDQLGSTRLLTNEAGEVTDRYTYDAYGSLLSHDALSGDPFTGSVRQPYQYVGQLGYYTHWERPDFKLLQLGLRFYDPETGRFTQRDPAQKDINYYLYVAANPLTFSDPTGLVKVYRCRDVEVAPGTTDATAIYDMVEPICGTRDDCREALRQALQYLENTLKNAQCVAHCRICNHDDPHHKWEKVIEGTKRTCWMKHIQFRCWNRERKPMTGWIRAPYEKCYKNRGGRGGTWD